MSLNHQFVCDRKSQFLEIPVLKSYCLCLCNLKFSMFFIVQMISKLEIINPELKFKIATGVHCSPNVRLRSYVSGGVCSYHVFLSFFSFWSVIFVLSGCRFVCSNRGDRCLCGTDGQTYRNTCEMRCNAQRFQMKIFKDHPGPCMEGNLR